MNFRLDKFTLKAQEAVQRAQALAQETYRSARMRMYEIDQMRHRLRAPVVTLIGDTDGER